MKKPEVVEDPAVAADQMDRVVDKILTALHSGQSARLPGLGTITPGKHWNFLPESHER